MKGVKNKISHYSINLVKFMCHIIIFVIVILRITQTTTPITIAALFLMLTKEKRRKLVLTCIHYHRKTLTKSRVSITIVEQKSNLFSLLFFVLTLLSSTLIYDV